MQNVSVWFFAAPLLVFYGCARGEETLEAYSVEDSDSDAAVSSPQTDDEVLVPPAATNQGGTAAIAGSSGSASSNAGKANSVPSSAGQGGTAATGSGAGGAAGTPVASEIEQAGNGGSISGGTAGEEPDTDPEEPAAFAETAVILIDDVRIVRKSDASVPYSETFDNGLGGWELDPFGSTPVFGSDLGAEELSAQSQLQTAADGGGQVLRGTVPFSSGSEQIDFNLRLNNEVNYAGHELIARIKLISGGTTNPNCPLGVQVYATSSNAGYFWAGTLLQDLTVAGDWQSLTMDLDSPGHVANDGMFNATQVNQIGVQVLTPNQSCDD